MSEKIKKDNKTIIRKVLAWIGLIIITILLFVMAYGLINQNGKLVLVAIVALAFVSILFWIGLKFAKDAEDYREAITKSEREKEMYLISHKNTKDL